jgi:NAD(P)-dependent dehydrogenase (short-subunit alcohol dehydrogenase family)
MNTFFAGKRFLVIGGSGVLGSEICRQLITNGAVVTLCSRTEANIPSDLLQLTRSTADIGSRDSLLLAINEIGGTFDGIINAAGVVAFGPIGEVPEEVVAELFRTNATGTVNVLSLGAAFVNEGGVIASLTGVAADVSVLGMSAYCASKSAAHSAMAVAAREFRSKKINVLDVRAPHTETGLVERALFGAAPKMPQGLEPSFVASRILSAIASGEKDLPADAFAQ